MIAHHLRIATDGQWARGTVELDGEDIANGVSGLSLALVSGEANRITLELFAPVVEFDGKAEVMLREETQALLKRLGWTPPEETP